jgi:multidrug transporter EmrE-like cation transporter
VTNQLKILTTAFFSVTMLGRTLTLVQWGALVVLMAGVVGVSAS